MTKIGGIVLAGGSSRRFNGDKRLATLADGATLLARSVANAAAQLPAVIVALRSGEEELAASITGTNVSAVCASDSALGMAHTMAAAFASIPADWDGAMVLLADMPFIRPTTYRTLTKAFRDATSPDAIIIPAYNGSPGHPVTFARMWFSEIRGLRGDEGARSIVKAHQEAVARVVVDDPAVLQDIDTQAALSAARAPC